MTNNSADITTNKAEDDNQVNELYSEIAGYILHVLRRQAVRGAKEVPVDTQLLTEI